MDEKERSTLSVEVDKELLLKFKSMCVLREHTMSEEIEKMISDWVQLNENPDTKGPRKASQKPQPGGDISDELESASETG